MEKNNIVKDLIIMFVTENYKEYLKKHNLKRIDDKEIPDVINKVYVEKKEKLKVWLKQCLKKIQGDDYMGDLAYQNLLVNIFEDDKFNCKRLELELIEYQKNTR